MKTLPLTLHPSALRCRLSIIATSLSFLLLASSFEIVLAHSPQPVIYRITPGNVTAGGQGFRLTVNGSGFFAGSVVRWNGRNLPTVFSSETRQLIAAISDSDIRTPGIAYITAINPDGLLSAPATLTITKPAASKGVSKSGPAPEFFIVPTSLPTLSSVGPAIVAQGARQVRLTLVGSNFKPGAKVVISPPLPEPSASAANQMATDISVDGVTRISDTVIVVVISVSDTAPIGVRAVDVVNPDKLNTAITHTSQPLFVASGRSLGAPLDVQTIVITYPRDGTVVSRGDHLFGEALLAGVGSGTITGEWIWDGYVSEQFTERMTGGERVVLKTSRSLPTSFLGMHNLELRITSPNLLRSRTVQVLVSPGTWKLMRLVAPHSSAGFAPDAPPLLRWAIIPGAAGYQVGFSTKPSFDAVDEWHDVDDTQWRVPERIWNRLPEGELYWTVRVIETSGQTREPALMRRIWRVPSGALNPTSGAPLRSSAGTVLPQWQPLKGQVVYRATVSRDFDGKDIVRRFVVSQPRADLRGIEGLLQPGQTYYWWVEAYSFVGRPVIAGPRQTFVAQAAPHPEEPFRAVKYEATSLSVPSLQGLDDRIASRAPGPNQKVSDARATITIEFKMAMTPSEISLLVDDTDVTDMIQAAESRIIFKPVIPLKDGEHQIKLSSRDQSDEWKFVVHEKAEVEANANTPTTQTEAEQAPASATGGGAEKASADTGPVLNIEAGSTTQWGSGSEGDTNALHLASQMTSQHGPWRAEINGSGLLNSMLGPEPRHSLGRFNDYNFRVGYEQKQLKGNLLFGLISPTLYVGSEFVTTVSAREGVELALHTPSGAFSFYSNIDDMSQGGGAGAAFHQQIRGASYEAPLPKDHIVFRLMSLNTRDVGTPAKIPLDATENPVSTPDSLAAATAGDAYGGLLTVNLGAKWLWASEYALTYNNPDTLLAGSRRLFGRAWRTGVNGALGKTTMSAAYRDVSAGYATPFASLSQMGTSGRRGTDMSLSSPTAIGTIAVTYQYLQSDVHNPNKPPNSLQNLTWNWSKNITTTTAIAVGGNGTRTSTGELPQAVAALTPDQQLALKTDQHGVGINASVTQRAGKITLTVRGERDWFQSRMVDKQNKITSSAKLDADWQASPFFKITSNLNVTWVAGEPSSVGKARITSIDIQPTLIWQRTMLSLAPHVAVAQNKTDLRGHLLTQDMLTELYSGQLTWKMPGTLIISTLFFDGGWMRTHNGLLGATATAPRLQMSWSLVWKNRRE